MREALTYEIVWSGAMDRQGTCPSLLDPSQPHPSTLGPAVQDQHAAVALRLKRQRAKERAKAKAALRRAA